MNRAELVSFLHKKGFRPDGEGGFSKTEPLSKPDVISHETSSLVEGIQDAQPKPDVGEALDSPAQAEEGSESRIIVSVTRCSKTLLDEDNLGGGKYAIDGLRYEKCIPDDRPGLCKIVLDQRKVKTEEEEGTLIEITYP